MTRMMTIMMTRMMVRMMTRMMTRMTGPLRWTVSSMWPEGRMTSLGLTRSMMMPI